MAVARDKGQNIEKGDKRAIAGFMEWERWGNGRTGEKTVSGDLMVFHGILLKFAREKKKNPLAFCRGLSLLISERFEC